MKVTHRKNPGFTPVTVSIEFESQQELDVFGSLLNLSSVTDALALVGSLHHIYSEFKLAGADISKYVEALDRKLKTRYHHL